MKRMMTAKENQSRVWCECCSMGKGFAGSKRKIALLAAAGIWLFLAGSVLAWDMPKLGGSSENVDVKGLLGRSDKLMELVMEANEKLGLGFADVLTMTGKTGDAEKLRQDIAAIKAKGKGKEGAEAIVARLDGSFSGFNKAGLQKSLEQAGTRLVSGTTIGSAAMNIKSALESDKKAVDES